MSFPMKDYQFWRGEAPHIIKQKNGDNVVLENQNTGEIISLPIQDLYAEYVKGKVLTVGTKKRKAPHSIRPAAQHDFETLGVDQKSEAARISTRRTIGYIVALNKLHAFDGSQKALRKAIVEVAETLKDPRPPHYTTVRRWRRRFRKAEQSIKALFSKIEKRGGGGKSRLEPTVEKHLFETINEVTLTKRRSSAEDVQTKLFLKIQNENAVRIQGEWLVMPSLRTIQRRISSLAAYDIAVARYGKKEADRQFRYYGPSRGVRRILELVEIDHTPLDVIVCNEDRVPIGRPTITVVFDRFSRCVLGFHISLAGHGTPAVFEAIRHALLPKSYLTSRYGDCNLVWDCHGWMELIVMDNGTEFHAKALEDALMNLGIPMEYAESRNPDDKPFVERFLKTLNYSFIHKLPGTTLSRVEERKGYKAEEEASMTLEELDKAIHVWVINSYHKRPHSGLQGRTPIDMWNESASAYPPLLKANAEDIDIEFCEIAESAVQHYGIDLNTFVYGSPELSHLRAMLPEKTKVTVKWPKYDVGHIYVWNPIDMNYFRVPNQDESYAGLTLDQAKAAKSKYKDEPDNTRLRANAADVVDQIVKDANEDKALKNRRKGARLANKSSKKLHRESETPQPSAPKGKRPTTAQGEDLPNFGVTSFSTEEA